MTVNTILKSSINSLKITEGSILLRSSPENYASNDTRQQEYNTSATRDTTTQHEFNTTKHETTRVQHDTTRVKHEATRVQYNTT